MEEIEKKVYDTIKKEAMLLQGGRVLVGVSGGADSVCLLCLLAKVREKLDLAIRAVHVHHGLRGAEADEDARFVERLCAKRGISCEVVRVDMPGYAREHGLCEEEAGRILRYQAMEELAHTWELQENAFGSVRIAVAHNSDDQAETILHNLCRGSGIKGLGGMASVRGRIIRPLLAVSREEIVGWLRAQGISWRTDSTNLTADYTRNRIRALLPSLETQINLGARRNIVKMGMLAAQADAYLEKQADEWIKTNVGEIAGRGEVSIGCEPFGELAEILKSYVVFRVLRTVSGSARDLGAGHVEQVLGLFLMAEGARWDLSGNVCAQKMRGSVRIFHRKKQDRNARRAQESQEAAFFLEYEEFPYKKGMEIPKNQYTKWFDCDKISGTPVLRGREEGDYLILANGHRKLLRRVLIDDKISREEREKIALLAEENHVIWIIGGRISEYYKIGPDTRRVLQVRAIKL